MLRRGEREKNSKPSRESKTQNSCPRILNLSSVSPVRDSQYSKEPGASLRILVIVSFSVSSWDLCFESVIITSDYLFMQGNHYAKFETALSNLKVDFILHRLY